MSERGSWDLRHRVDWTIDGYNVTPAFTCESDPDALCRLTCGGNCEVVSVCDECAADPDDPTNDPEHSREPLHCTCGLPHQYLPADQCHVISWLTAEGDSYAIELYNGPRAPLVSGPIEVDWMNDACEWHYPTEASR